MQMILPSKKQTHEWSHALAECQCEQLDKKTPFKEHIVTDIVISWWRDCWKASEHWHF